MSPLQALAAETQHLFACIIKLPSELERENHQNIAVLRRFHDFAQPTAASSNHAMAPRMKVSIDQSPPSKESYGNNAMTAPACSNYQNAREQKCCDGRSSSQEMVHGHHALHIPSTLRPVHSLPAHCTSPVMTPALLDLCSSLVSRLLAAHQTQHRIWECQIVQTQQAVN